MPSRFPAPWTVRELAGVRRGRRAPIVYDGPFPRWDTDANKIISIIDAGVRFDGTVKPLAPAVGTEEPEPAKKRWWLFG